MSFRILIITASLFLNTVVSSQEPKLILPVGHTTTSSVNFSPDEKRIITAAENTNKLWDALSGRLLAVFPVDEGLSFSGKFSSDNKKILTISRKSASIWDATSATLLAELKTNGDFLTTAKFSANGKQVVTVSDDSTVTMWDAESKKILFSRKEPSYINSAEFSPAGKTIVITCANGNVTILDAYTGNLIFSLIGHKATVWYSEYSNDGKKLLTVSFDKSVKIWDASTGTLQKNFSGSKLWLVSAHFSPDAKKIIASYADSTSYGVSKLRRPARNGRPVMSKTLLKTALWDTETGNQLLEFKGLTKVVRYSSFSNDGRKILTVTEDFIASLWDAGSGDLITTPDFSSLFITKAQFSRDGNKIIAVNYDGTIQIWSLISGKVLTTLKGHSYNTDVQFSPDRKKIITNPGNNSINISDAFTGDLLTVLKGHKSKIYEAQFSRNGKKIATSSHDSTVKIWNTDNGELLVTIKTNSPSESIVFSPDGKKIVSSNEDYYHGTSTIWDVETGIQLMKLNGHTKGITSMSFNEDATKIVTASYDSTAIIWNVETGEKILELKGHKGYVYSAEFSPDYKSILTSSFDNTSKIWDATSGKIMADFTAHTRGVTSAHFSPDGNRVATSSEDGTAKIWNAVDGKLLHDLKDHSNIVTQAGFSPSGKKLLTVSWDHTVKIWDVASGKLLSDMIGYNTNILSADFYMDETKVIISTRDNMVRIWDIQSAKVLYSLLGIDSTDFLVIDNQFRFDGTEAARKLLYFTCGTEIIELDQVKDQLWVPNLAERVMNGETINAQKLSDLNICNLTPVVETMDHTALQYRFQITPRLGGLSATIVYVNGIEVKRYTQQQLAKQKENYQLLIDKKDLQKFFIPGKENSIAVKSLTAKSSISSRSASINEKGKELIAVAPNLYAVVVGVSDYKGEQLDLKFAAKDAVDIGNTLDASARKLLNTDGKEHVFIYRINTGATRDKFPEKNSIKQAFTEIAAKAQPNDILLVFFAGHGLMSGENNQFYFLTADASTATVTGAIKDVGISTDELTEWIKPQVMKAQKRILIFDACNSGQAIKEIISVGKKEQNFLAARGDDKSRQIKAVEKLNERSGMFILSASASDQRAYEMGKYNQGALTYSLLKAIKEQPDILEDRQYLNISRWFNAAEKSVNELARETGASQQPQIVSTTNFNIGVVDEEVRNKIVLPFEKPMFTKSEFRNTALRIDDLKLRSMVDKELDEQSGIGSNSPIMYSPDYDGVNVLAISGDYTVKGTDVLVSIILTKGGTEIKARIEVKGERTDLGALSKKITLSVLDWLKAH